MMRRSMAQGVRSSCVSGVAFSKVGFKCSVAACALGILIAPARSVDTNQKLSPFTSTTFNTDGQILEFINVGGTDSQNYFVTDTLLPGMETHPNFGAILHNAILTRGVFVRRDNLPIPGTVTQAGQAGFRDPPVQNIPTGFNIGRVFASYNPNAYGGNDGGAYFLAMDISAPRVFVFNPLQPNLPAAFDIDGDGSRLVQSRPVSIEDTEAPLGSTEGFREGYLVRINTDNVGLHEITIIVAEQVTGSLGAPLSAGAVTINPPCCSDGSPRPADCPASAQVIDGFCVERYVLMIDTTGTLPGINTPEGRVINPRPFLDANNDGVLDYRDIGVDSDVELVVRNVALLPRNANPSCVSFVYCADSFDDAGPFGGGEDCVEIESGFPVPDIEATKEGRCASNPTAPFSRRISATPGDPIEFRVTVQNRGNRDLNVQLTDALGCLSADARVLLVPGSCAIVGSRPAGVPANFCQLFEIAMGQTNGFPMTLGRLNAAGQCAIGLGEQLVFTYRANTEALGDVCDQAVDCANAVSVLATMVQEVDPILAPDPPSTDSPNGNAEEEDCLIAAGCCPPANPACANDGVGDVDDEFNFTVFDDARAIDTLRELAAVPPADDNFVDIELDCRDLELIKEVRRFGSPAFVSGTTPVNLPADPLAYGASGIVLEYRFRVTNRGENAETVTISDSDFCADVIAAPGVDFVNCELCAADATPGSISGSAERLIGTTPGTFSTTCTVRFQDANNARAFMSRDDLRPACRAETGTPPAADPLCYRNCADLSIPPSPCDSGFQGDSFATICFIDECILGVAKTVHCLDSCPDGTVPGNAADSLTIVPGGCAQFEVRIENRGPVDIPLICIDDGLTCSWQVINVAFDINGTAVVPSPAFVPNGMRQCLTIAGRPRGIEPGQTLRLVFNVSAPTDVAAGIEPDCRNTVVVGGYKNASDDTSRDPDRQCRGSDAATLDAQVPDIDCSKTVTVDNDDDGSIDFPESTFATLSAPSYPIRLTYKLTARNTGETPILNAKICDAELVADARAAGISVENCALCTGPCDGVDDSCVNVGTLDPREVETRPCDLVIASPAEWEGFARRDTADNREECYLNRMEASGDLDLSCAPAPLPRTVRSGECPVSVCIPVIPGCPVTKAKFDIWNQNEVRFSGTERCVISWDQELLSTYTGAGIPNNFVRPVLQTEKGRARIDGIESPDVCGVESVPAPLLGVAAKVVSFGRELELAGNSLVGNGAESGFIKYAIPPGPSRAKFREGESSEAAAGPVDFGARSNASVKGSLVVFTKVELKWNPQFQQIQETFIDLTNDYPLDVRVQLYFVNGDQPTAAIITGNPPREEERAHPGCNAVDNVIVLTGNEPTYWAASTGSPKGVSPFTIVDPGFPPGRPDTDPRNPGGRVLRGYVLAWAVDESNEEIRWNHLSGDALIVNYALTYAWGYPSWNFPAVAGLVEGDRLLDPPGQMNLDGVEYAFPPNQLLMDFYASGAVLTSAPGRFILIDTDLTLWAAVKDLRIP